MDNSTISRAMLGIVAAALVSPVVAQNEPTSFLEEITVTASKRQTTLQDTPIAVSVLAADDLKQASVILASFLYHAAMRDKRMPRKPMPKPRVK